MLIIGKNSSFYRNIKDYLPPHSAVSHLDVPTPIDDDIILASFPMNSHDPDGYMSFLKAIDEESNSARQRIFISTAGLNGVPEHLINAYPYLRLKVKCEDYLLSRGWIIVRLGSLTEQSVLSGDWLVASFDFLERLAGIKKGSVIYGVKKVRLCRRASLASNLLNCAYKFFAFRPNCKYVALLLHALNSDSNRGYSFLSNSIAFSTVSIGAGLSTLNARRNIDYYIVPPRCADNESIGNPKRVSYSKRTAGFGDRWHAVKGKVDSQESVQFLGYTALSVALSNPILVLSSRLLRLKNFFRNILRLDVMSIALHDSEDGVLVCGTNQVFLVGRIAINAGVYESSRILASASEEQCTLKFSSQYVFSIASDRLSETLPTKFPLFKKRAWKVRDNPPLLFVIRPPLPAVVVDKLVFGSTKERFFAFFNNFNLSLLTWLLYSKASIAIFKRNQAVLDIQYSVIQEARFLDGQVEVDDISASLKEVADNIETKVRQHLGETVRVREPFDALHVTCKTPLHVLTDRLPHSLKALIDVGPVHQLFSLQTADYTSHTLLEYREESL